jgi:hypothetical protein
MEYKPPPIEVYYIIKIKLFLSLNHITILIYIYCIILGVKTELE